MHRHSEDGTQIRPRWCFGSASEMLKFLGFVVVYRREEKTAAVCIEQERECSVCCRLPTEHVDQAFSLVSVSSCFDVSKTALQPINCRKNAGSDAHKWERPKKTL